MMMASWRPVLVVLCGLLGMGHAQPPRPPLVTEAPSYPGNYLITAPNTIRPGWPFTLSVSIFSTTGPASVSLAASIIKGNAVVVSSVTSHAVGTMEVTLMIPNDALPGEDYSLRVIGSNGLVFNETKALTFNVDHFSIFVQSDKAIYKPGQTVRFRVLAIYPNLRPYKGPFSVTVKDANENVIERWINEPTNKNGIISKEMVMSDHPVMGEWTIKAEAEGQVYDYTFEIDEYVLPKFEVTVSAPVYFTSSASEVAVSVTAKYTFGKPVEGSFRVNASSWYNSQQQHITGQLEDGKAIVTFSRDNLASTTSSFGRSNLYDGTQFQFTASVTEKLTGVTLESTSAATSSFRFYPVKVEFSSTVSRSNFKPGLPYQVYLTVTYQDGSPLTEAERAQGLSLSYCVSSNCYSPDSKWTVLDNLPIAPYTGVVEASINAPRSSDSSFHIEAEFQGTITPYGDVRLPMACRDGIAATAGAYRACTTKYIDSSRSDSNVFIQVRAADSHALTIGSQTSFIVQSTVAPGKLTYQIVSRGNIIQTATISGVTGTEYTIDKTITVEMSPKSKLIVFFLSDSGEVILDSLEFVVNVVFNNKVKANFSRVSGEPGDSVSFDVEASQGSFIGILAIDRSVQLLADGNDIKQEQVLESLGRFDTTPDNGWGGYNPFRDVVWCFFPYYTSGETAGQILKNAGIIYITDGNVLDTGGLFMDFIGRPVAAEAGIPEAGGAVPDEADQAGRTNEGNAVPENDVRKDFPETWLWVDSETDASGRVSIQTHFPDTITSWVGTALAMHDTDGLGLTDNAAMATVFKTFFVSLNLPYSVIRGEKFVMDATVFNYLDKAIIANVELESSKDYYILNYTNSVEKQLSTPLTKSVYIEANRGATVQFPIEPTKSGMIELVVRATSGMEQDGVSRFLLVEPEGVAQEYVVSDLVNFDESSSYSRTFNIDLPNDVVPDSVRAKVTATGDILGPTMSNLDQLLRMPTGCGEQTMISFAPDVFIYKYLTDTNASASDVIKQKALNFMKMGYQRELTYQHTDGSFSAWGKTNGDPGSTWLTAFVVRSFLQASPYIYIDPEKVWKAVDFLRSNQNQDGSFEKVGRIVDQGIEGGVSSVETLTAYCAIAMDQARRSDIFTVTRRSLAETSMSEAIRYLEGRKTRIQDDKYAMSIVTYALVLGGSSRSSEFRTRLDELKSSESDGNTVYWTDQDAQTTPANDEEFYYRVWRGPPSAAIEMTGYALLSYLASNDIDRSVPISRWLTQQRNSYGGYSSTQDTVLALLALTTYATLVDATNKDITLAITATADATYNQGFSVTSQNSIVLQQFELPVTSGNVTIAGSGTGSFLLSFVLHYNLQEVRNNNVFVVTVTIEEAQLQNLQLRACGRYTGGNEGTGMAIMDIGIPSGFYALEDRLTQAVQDHVFATKYEIMGKSVIIYLHEIPAEETCITVHAARSNAVAGTKPSVVKVYSYYTPTDQTVVTYSAASLSDSNICSVCTDCCPDSPDSGSNSPLMSLTLLLTLTLFSCITALFI